MTGRAAPFYCPYCGDEDLRPHEGGHDAWECASCNRAFRLAFLGLLARGFARPGTAGARPRTGDGSGTDAS
ncbi:hypothetical protein [Streptomyces sp. 7-21]|uniref:hypothetical protein n=1 Tax=Streptomyces sp. 7-21 TaxID=2802283 RepID=UPI00191F0640|nr:hypothetical protein [Streptomyces sp. 7-21]MBL1067025.1 hypothetical protein [Streptomyces sp. 7-21]